MIYNIFTILQGVNLEFERLSKLILSRYVGFAYNADRQLPPAPELIQRLPLKELPSYAPIDFMVSRKEIDDYLVQPQAKELMQRLPR